MQSYNYYNAFKDKKLSTHQYVGVKSESELAVMAGLHWNMPILSDNVD